MLKYNQEIIAAISTPVGEGAISIVRVSGDGCIELIDKIFKGKIHLAAANSHTIHFGCITNHSEEAIDEVLVSVFRNPNSYTSEDMVEINCHGGWFVTNKILQIILDSGIRMAKPGEFTKRAFLNGKIDLAQAEAVADLIKARSDLAHKVSISQLEGNLSHKIININSQLINLIGLIELELDFVEENIILTEKSSIIETLLNILSKLQNLIDTYQQGRLCREGIKVVIAGRPNSGKSSLLNLLLGEDRAIVTPHPGTTRDIIEENFIINGILFKLTDTAGIRSSIDNIEIEGVRRSHKKIKESDIVLFLVDISQDTFEEEVRLINQLISDGKTVLIVLNKIDLVQKEKLLLNPISSQFQVFPIGQVSAITGTGIHELKKLAFDTVFSNNPLPPEGGILISAERHRQELVNAKKSLELAMVSVNNNLSGEFISIDIRAAINSLGTITGEVTTDDILNDIFSKFCIGK